MAEPVLFNPYATALDGLKLDDPVAAFFDFCKERENIRLKRAQGKPGPWTKDEVFQNGRFLNVFREDDRGTKALLKFVKPLTENPATKVEVLVQALFFARWCNRDHTLVELNPNLLSNPKSLKKALAQVPMPPWCNETAYPVETVTWKGTEYSRLDAATDLFHKISTWLVETIKSTNGDVVLATRAIAKELGMKNDFPVFMAVMDLAWFRPDLVDPASKVPTGIGALAYLERLQKHLGLKDHEETAEKMIALQADYWPEAKRPFQPIDIEYLSCECRKYYSYIIGTKKYEGKNVFKPGKSPMLTFDMPYKIEDSKAKITDIYVIAGGPCSGKTSILKALNEKGYETIPETAEQMIKAGVKAGIPVEQQRKDPVAWQMDLLKKDYLLFDQLADRGSRKIVLTDTSFIETVVFAARAGIEMGPAVESWIQTKRYQRVFFLLPIEEYNSSMVRMESSNEAMVISQEVQEAYKNYGYDLTVVPPMPLEDRCKFVEDYIKKVGA